MDRDKTIQTGDFASMNMLPEWAQVTAPQLLSGLYVTLQLSCMVVIASCLLGLVLGVLSASPYRSINGLILAYVAIWRGLPIVVTLFLMYFALPIFGITLIPLAAASVGLTLWGSANLAVIVKGAIDSIPDGQYRSSSALGMNLLERMRLVIVPQAMRRMIAPSIGIIMILIQATSAASLIDVKDVLFVGRSNIERLTLMSGESHALPILGAILVIFYVVSYLLNRLAVFYENRLTL